MVLARRTAGRALSQSQAALYICRSCRHQLSRTTGLSVQQQRFASNNTEQLHAAENAQKKLPGSENASGLRSSHGRPGFSAKRPAQTLAEHDIEDVQGQRQEEHASGPAGMQELQTLKKGALSEELREQGFVIPQYVGARGNWRDVPAGPEDNFQPWMDTTSHRATSREELESCMRQALVEDGLIFEGEEEPLTDLRLDEEDPDTFKILKRFSHLSGHRIPDPTLNALFSLNEPLSYMIDQMMEKVVKPKPQKIVDILMQKSTFNEQSNVMILPRRETSIDKEKEVGRWKVIAKELKERGLPVTGTLKSQQLLRSARD